MNMDCQMSREGSGQKDVFPPYMEGEDKSALPSDSAERKKFPMFTGLLRYFPDALALVSKLSYEGNQKHNPGQPLHWAKDKSTDHADCIVRHLTDSIKAESAQREIEEATAVAWRALAYLQTLFENRPAKPAVPDVLLSPPSGQHWTSQDYWPNIDWEIPGH